ncbi:MAG: RICIN domain-containing protein [Kofleriaceae bacterium]
MNKQSWCLIAIQLGVAACALDETDVDYSEDQASIRGHRAPLPNDYLRIWHGDDTILPDYSAFVVHGNLAIGSRDPRAFVRNPSRWETIRPNGSSQTVKFINVTASFPELAVYHLPGSPGPDRIDPRTAAALAGVQLECWGSNGSPAQPMMVPVRVTGGTTTDLDVTSTLANEFLDSFDKGIPCTTTVEPRMLVGLVKTANPNTHTAKLYRAEALRFWIDGMVNLAAVRDDVRNEGPFTISTDTAIVGAPRMCFDLPSEDPHANNLIQQSVCHSHANQLFYIDRRVTDGGANPRLVAAISGRCIDIEWGQAIPGLRLQQFDCHDGNNQKWALGGRVNTQLRPKSAPALCATVQGGPTTQSAQIDQETCSFDPLDFKQLWTMTATVFPR